MLCRGQWFRCKIQNKQKNQRFPDTIILPETKSTPMLVLSLNLDTAPFAAYGKT